MAKNTITSEVTGSVVTVDIAECDRIQVKRGDVIGIYFPPSMLGVEWTKCEVEEQPDFAVVRHRHDEDTLRPGQVDQFKNYGCLKLSLQAVVGPVRSCALPPVEAEVESVSSEASVDVGHVVEYKCNSGFKLLSGDLKRRCGPCRELEGVSPTCGGGWLL